jgi:hypothetical protein
LDGERGDGQDRRHRHRLQRLECQLDNETTALVGLGSQTASLSRWGDYSTISVDPVDGCTMVFTSQFQPANGNFNWSTYIHSFKLSTCN